jgi:hypothetical protein
LFDEKFIFEKLYFDRKRNENHIVFNEQCALENQKQKFVISMGCGPQVRVERSLQASQADAVRCNKDACDQRVLPR